MFLILILSSFKVPSSSAVSVGHHRHRHRHRDFATDLNATNFDLVLRGARTTYAIVEFYAHWYVLIYSSLYIYVFQFHCGSIQIYLSLIHTYITISFDF